MFAHFNHSQFRKYIAVFGRLFSQIEVRRGETANGTPYVPDDLVTGQRLRVPIQYGPKSGWYVHREQNPNLDNSVRMVLPRMGYELKSISYDSTRHLNTLDILTFTTPEARKLAKLYVGVPYKLNFELGVLVNLQSDGFEIVEQIMPYFSPDLVFAIPTIPELGIVDTIPLSLQGISCNDNYQGDFEKDRLIEWTLTFDMPVWFWGYRQKQSRIEEVLLDIFAVSGDISRPPVNLETENDLLLVNEDGSGGHIMDESTSNTYIGTERVVSITTTADPRDQDPMKAKEDITFTESIERFGDG